MHQWAIDEREYRRQEQRRGRRHAYPTLVPAWTALVVVDMVDFFVETNPYCEGIVSNIERLADSVRSSGGIVAWLVPATGPATTWQNEFYGPPIAATYAASGGDGPARDRVWNGHRVDNTDLVEEKRSASAFFPDSCTLHDQLVDLGIDTVLVAGTVANVCCESTARDAATLGFRVVMVADAMAAVRDEDLNATLYTVYRSFGDVRSTDDIVELISQASPATDC